MNLVKELIGIIQFKALHTHEQYIDYLEKIFTSIELSPSKTKSLIQDKKGREINK